METATIKIALDLSTRKEFPMSIEFGFTDQYCDTQYAALVVICAHYQQKQVLAPLEQMQNGRKERDFRLSDKLIQMLLSALAGCETLSEVNSKLKSEQGLAEVWGWKRIADQSTLSRKLDQLSLKQIEQLRHVTTQIWRSHSKLKGYNWHAYLWLDYDLSSLPCGPQAEEAQKGYASGKKKRGWVPISQGERSEIPRNGVVGRFSWQLPYRTICGTCGRVCRNCIRLITQAAKTNSLALGWWRWKRRSNPLAPPAWLSRLG
jgi:hypothetical protein